MATLKQIRQRIRTAKNIQQITRAMKLVAAARLKKATDRVLEARSYADKLQEFMQSLSRGTLPSHPLLEKRDEVRNVCLILVTADRGLAGAYNTSLLRKASDWLKQQETTVKLLSVGKKGAQFFGRRGYEIAMQTTLPGTGATLADGQAIVQRAQEMFESGEVDAIYLCYSKFYSPIRQVPRIVQLLPIEPPQAEGAEAVSVDYQFEPSAKALLGQLLPRYFFTLVWQALLESAASEHGARMTAMTSATDNAKKMIDSLTLKANRERQATITKEILEVVGGAEALKS